MSRSLFTILSITILALVFVGCQQERTPLSSMTDDATDSTNPAFGPTIKTNAISAGKIIIANRGSGSISVIDVTTDQITGTFELPEGTNPAEPMYVVYNIKNNTIFVGDRGNDRVVAFDAKDFSVKATIKAGSGVFHMWADPRGRQLWVNNDGDKTITVIDPISFSVITSVKAPADLVEMGGKPHDVILDPKGAHAFVTFLGFQSESDYVVKYSTSTFNEMGRAAVGKDPHVSLTQKNNLLYVPCQNSNVVYILDQMSLKVTNILDVPGAHGAGMALNGRTFYTTNLPGGGPSGLYTIDVKSNAVIAHTDAPFPVPHNIVLTPNGKKLYVTHSGSTANKISVYRIQMRSQVPEFHTEITVGTNPFGLAFAK